MKNENHNAKRKPRQWKIFNSAFITSYERDNESDLDFAEARYYKPTHGRFTSVDPYNVNLERQYAGSYDNANRLLFEYITKPLHWNAYSYTLNNPLNYVDPSGELEEIIARVNIIYDRETIKTEAAARKLTAKIVADAMKVYKTAGITLEVSYTAGAANTNSVYGVLAGGPSQEIKEGKEPDAVNVFISNDLNYLTGGSSNTGTGESFINYGGALTISGAKIPVIPDEGLLSHELGHQFGYPASVYGVAKAEGLVESTNAALRKGQTQITETLYQNLPYPLPPIPTGSFTVDVTSVYRQGARRFEPKPKGAAGRARPR